LRTNREIIELVLSFTADGSGDEHSDSKVSSNKLSKSESIEILIDKSMDYWNQAQSSLTDPNLLISRQILSIAPPKSSKALADQLRQLDALEIYGSGSDFE
uniref:HRDC domain-containing protein n=1 Tax=Anisakis simplex TaxID=6269 RepID=A0A0M3JQ52_ANISI